MTDKLFISIFLCHSKIQIQNNSKKAKNIFYYILYIVISTATLYFPPEAFKGTFDFF